MWVWGFLAWNFGSPINFGMFRDPRLGVVEDCILRIPFQGINCHIIFESQQCAKIDFLAICFIKWSQIYRLPLMTNFGWSNSIFFSSNRFFILSQMPYIFLVQEKSSSGTIALLDLFIFVESCSNGLWWKKISSKTWIFQPWVILLMEEILHHLGCIKPCK